MYDLVICGGGTAGAACGYIAAKSGLKTLIVERNIHLGGSITSALVTPAMKSDRQGVNCDFYNDFVKKMSEFGGQITYSDGNDGWFNPEIAKIVLDDMLTEAGCDILFGTDVAEVNCKENLIKSIKVNSKILSLYIESRYFVDSTGDGNFSMLAKNKILENYKNFQPMTLRFHVSGINLEKFSNWIMELDKNREVTTSCTIDGEIHLSTACTWDKSKNWALWDIFEQAVNNGDLEEADTAYFQLFTVPGMRGTVSLNCPRIITGREIDPLDASDVSRALIIGRKQVWRLFKFMKKYFPGFEESFISNMADMLGIRESRRIQGKTVYTKKDILSGKTYENPVLNADYPIDIHSYNKDTSVLDKVKQPYQLPFEALCASDYENLFIAGRNVSADFEAQAALRIQTSCFSMGEAVAKHVANLLNG